MPAAPLLIALIPAFLIGLWLFAFLFHPLLAHIAGVVAEPAIALAGMFAVLARRLRYLEHALRALTAQAVRDVTVGPGTAPSKTPVLDGIVRPIGWAVIFSYLAFSDFYLTSLGFVGLLGLGDVPARLPILGWKANPALMMGFLWSAIATAFGAALFESSLERPHLPFSLLGQRARRVVQVVAICGIAAIVVAATLFFLWRQGARHPGQAHHPFSGLQWPVVAVLGATLQSAVAISSWSLVYVLLLAGVVVIVAAWLAVAALSGLSFGLARGFKTIGRLIETFLRAPADLLERIDEAFARGADALGAGASRVVTSAGSSVHNVAPTAASVGRASGRGIAGMWRDLILGVRAVVVSVLGLVGQVIALIVRVLELLAAGVVGFWAGAVRLMVWLGGVLERFGAVGVRLGEWCGHAAAAVADRFSRDIEAAAIWAAALVELVIREALKAAVTVLLSPIDAIKAVWRLRRNRDLERPPAPAAK